MLMSNYQLLCLALFRHDFSYFAPCRIFLPLALFARFLKVLMLLIIRHQSGFFARLGKPPKRFLKRFVITDLNVNHACCRPPFNAVKILISTVFLEDLFHIKQIASRICPGRLLHNKRLLSTYHHCFYKSHPGQNWPHL
jgi:hypothetical protein